MRAAAPAATITPRRMSAPTTPQNKKAMLVARLDAKILEDQQEDKNVVQAEGFFNDVAGKKFEPRTAPVREEKIHVPKPMESAIQAALSMAASRSAMACARR